MKALCIIVGMGPGISLAVARRFGAAGFTIAMIGLHHAKLQSLAEILLADSIEATGFVADAGDEASLRNVLQSIRDQMGHAAVLVYNASASHSALPASLSTERLIEDLRVNVAGALIAAQAVAPAMISAGSGTILFTGGGQALDPDPMLASLAIGKAGIRSLAFSLAKELEPSGVHVATVTVCGFVQPGGHFDPATIAGVFYRLHEQTAGTWEREVIYR